MPWIGCELWAAEFAEDGSVGRKKLIAGSDDESIFQPEWSPDRALYFVSDRAQPSLDGRWWNLFRVRGDVMAGSAPVDPVFPLAAEFGRAQWQFRMSTFDFAAAGELVCSYAHAGINRLSRVDPGVAAGERHSDRISRTSLRFAPIAASSIFAAARPPRRPASCNWISAPAAPLS